MPGKDLAKQGEAIGMGKKSRKAVSAALHSELTEYSSLLRALKTNHTLDLASHLTQSQPTSANPSEHDPEEDVDLDDDLGESERHDDDEYSPHNELLSSPSGRPKSQEREARDNWTRWPLLSGDVNIPEWELEDEITLLASNSLRPPVLPDNTKGPLPHERVETELINEETEPLSAAALRSFTNCTSAHLARILSAISAHIPLAEKSMQNRIRPISWENVLDVVSSSGLVHENVVQTVQRRMEKFYGAPQKSPTSEKRSHVVVANAKRRRNELFSNHALSFLSFPPGPKGSESLSIKRKKYKSKEIVENSDTETSEDRDEDNIHWPHKRRKIDTHESTQVVDAISPKPFDSTHGQHEGHDSPDTVAFDGPPS